MSAVRDSAAPASSQGSKMVRFAGYAAIFDRVDRGGDVVRPGAFRRAIERGARVPLLWQHRSGAVVGEIEHLSEDRRGLRVIARIGRGESARRAARLLVAGELDGLSFGYRVREARGGDGVRELVDLDLVEVSLVEKPMQPSARVHRVEG